VETRPVTLIPVLGIPLIQTGDDLVRIILDRLEEHGNSLESGDILVLTQKIVSKAEGAIVDLNSCKPSQKAVKVAQSCGKDPRMVELILRESKKILRQGRDLIITEHKKGWVCSNSGIDYSNVPGEFVTLLPEDPDRTAREIRQRFKKLLGVEIAVIIVDSHGRPFRKGAVGIAIGSSGICPLVDKRGKRDLFNYRLKSTEIAWADEIASAASLLLGQANTYFDRLREWHHY
jgi:coenzyme F420-0:L-glutamate ligase/coenzyme F420-1:gamma-L-glutamate ligase